MFGRATFVKMAAVLASGLMVAGLFPPFGFTVLAWVAFIPLLIVLWQVDGRHRAKKGFFIGYMAGLVSGLVSLWWLTSVTVLGAVLLPLYLAIFWGFFGAFAATIGNPWRREGGPGLSLMTAFTHATFWAGLEWLRSWLFTGFGWNGLGVAFHDTRVMSQAADLVGVAGLSLMVVFFQCVLVQVGRRMLMVSRDGKRRPRWDFGLTAAMVAVLICYGLIRIAGENARESIPLRSLLVQINIPQDAARVLWEGHKVHMAYEEDTLAALEKIAKEDAERLEAAVSENDEGVVSLNFPDWVLWPETALTGRLLRTDDGAWAAWMQNIETTGRVLDAGNFELIYGVVEIEGEKSGDEMMQKENAKIYNSIVIQNADGDLQTFRKRHLVIFGETIPLIDSLPFLRKIYEQQAGVEYGGSFAVGESLEPLRLMLRGTAVSIIPSVCFEDTVPRLARKFVRNEPQVIVNLTNDGWFKESVGAAQHFANARFRAIELRRPMLRCANTGVSAALDSTGSAARPGGGGPQIIRDENGSHFTRDSLLTELRVPLKPGFSLYAMIGDWGIIGLWFLGMAIAWFGRSTKAPEYPELKSKDMVS